MFLEFETINFTSPIGITNWVGKSVVNHINIKSFDELEDGTLQIFFEDESFIISKTFNKHDLQKKLNDLEEFNNIIE